jgi:hypothetical protein
MAMEDSSTLKPVNGKRGRNPQFIGPTPGPDPFKELKNDLGEETRTFRIVSAMLLYFVTQKPSGGHVPHTTIAKIAKCKASDAKVIVDAWAGTLFNQVIKEVDGLGNPTKAVWGVNTCPYGQTDSSTSPNPLPDKIDTATSGVGQSEKVSNRCPYGQDHHSGSLGDKPVEDLSVVDGPGHNDVLSTSYNNQKNTPESHELERMLDLFQGDESWYGKDFPKEGQHGVLISTKSESKSFTRKEWLGFIKGHFKGKRRISVYPIRTSHPYKDMVRFGVFDLDGGNRQGDATRLIDVLEDKNISAYLERSLSGDFRVWFFLRTWTHAGTIYRYMRSILDETQIIAEIRPSTNEINSVDGPDQSAIALPYFGDGGPQGDQCRFIDCDLFIPISLSHFLESTELNEPDLFKRYEGSPSHDTNAPMTHKKGPRIDVNTLVDSWPPIAEGEYHETPNGKIKGGRNDAAVAHAGELIGRGFTYDETLKYIMRWNGTCKPPLSEKELRNCMKWCEDN